MRCSYIKFGSYDPENVKPGHEMTMFKTIDVLTWSLKLADFSIGTGTEKE